MKFCIKTTLVVAAALCLFSNETHSQCPPPVDYPAFPFISGTPITWTDPCGCVITVEWCFRTVFVGGVPTFYDTEITAITSDCPPGVLPCATADEISSQALRIIIATINPWGVVIPCCPETFDSWRFFGSSCVTEWWYDPVLNVYRRDDCGEISCWHIISACFTCDPEDPGAVVFEETFTPIGRCPTEFVTPYQTTVPCEASCGQ